MTTPLRIPTVLAFTVLGIAVATSAGSCDRGTSTVDAAICMLCVPDVVGSETCPGTSCATGPDYNVCPEGCSLLPPPV